MNGLKGERVPHAIYNNLPHYYFTILSTPTLHTPSYAPTLPHPDSQVDVSKGLQYDHIISLPPTPPQPTPSHSPTPAPTLHPGGWFQGRASTARNIQQHDYVIEIYVQCQPSHAHLSIQQETGKNLFN